jgi:hypothetical protein
MDIQFDRNMLVIPIDKAILVHTRAEFLEALKRGKRFRQQQDSATPVAKAAEARTECVCR